MIIPIHTANYADYLALTQPYEQEFAPLTGASPDSSGHYPLSTDIDANHPGFLYLHQGKAVGFIVVQTNELPYDVCEIFVTKAARELGVARKLAFYTFNQYPGAWTVKELINAKKSRAFWLKILTEYTAQNFEETLYEDPKWGWVYKQQFNTR